MINGGIDQQVQQKVDAYRSKPQLLQQRYAQNKQLIDLLALQKLKSEKDAIARDMQMQMQQNPQTIKDQLEAEMVQRTKQDMMGKVGQVAGVLNKKQADQMKRAQRMGVASAPAPNMAQMAGGGIVGFAGPTGSEVTLEDYEGVDLSGATYGQQMTSEYKKIKQKQRDAELLNRYQDLLSRRGRLNYMEIKELERLQGKFSPEVGADGPEPSEAEPPMGPTPNFVAPEESPATPQPETETEMEPESETPAPPTPQSGIATALGTVQANKSIQVPERTGVSQLTAPTVDYTKADALSADLAEAFRKDSTIDPSKVETDEYKKFLERIGYSPEERALRQKRIDEMEDIRARRLDPEALAREEMSAFLRGAAGRSTTGMTLAGAGAGAASARKAAQKAETGLLQDVMGAETDLMKELAAQRLGSTEQSVARAGQAELRKGRGLEGLAGLSEGQARRAEAEAERLLKTNVANLEAGDRQRKMELDTLISNASNDLKRDIAVLEGSIAQDKNRLTEESNAALRESTDKRYAEQVLGSVNNYIASISQKYDKLYTDRMNQVPYDQRFAGDEKAINAEIARLQKERDEQLGTTLQDLQQQRTRLESFLGGGESGYSARRVR